MIRALTYDANTYELKVTVVDNLSGTSGRCIGAYQWKNIVRHRKMKKDKE